VNAWVINKNAVHMIRMVSIKNIQIISIFVLVAKGVNDPPACKTPPNKKGGLGKN
jgi:hypothetical protein